MATEVRAIREDSAGRWWLGNRHGLWSRDAAGTIEHFVGALPHRDVRTLEIGPDGALWVDTLNGVCAVRGGRWTTLPPALVVGGNHVTTLFADRAGALWIGTRGAGLRCWKDEGSTFFQRRRECRHEHRLRRFGRRRRLALGKHFRRAAALRPSELDDYAAGRRADFGVRVFDRDDGLPTVQFTKGRRAE